MSVSPDELPEWSATKAAWIVVDSVRCEFACKTCGAVEPFTVPVVLMDWVAASQSFVEAHKAHKPAPVAEVETEGLF